MTNRHSAVWQKRYADIRRQKKYGDNLIQCKICGRKFAKLGSHIVQAHNYETARDYRKEYCDNWKTGKDTMIQELRKDCADKCRENKTIDNLKNGVVYRFHKGGNHGKVVKNYWKWLRLKEMK